MREGCPQYLTREAAEEWFGLAVSDVRRAFRDLENYRMGGPTRSRVYVKAEALADWIEMHAEGTRDG